MSGSSNIYGGFRSRCGGRLTAAGSLTREHDAGGGEIAGSGAKSGESEGELINNWK